MEKRQKSNGEESVNNRWPLDHPRNEHARRILGNAMSSHLIIGIPNEYYNSVKLDHQLDQLLASKAGRDALSQFIKEKVVPNLKEGETILNPNIPASFLHTLLSAQTVKRKSVASGPQQKFKAKMKGRNR